MAKKYCMHPFENAEIHLRDKVYFHQCCPSWLKESFATFTSEDLLTLWNSQQAQEIRQSILDNTYKFCNKELCPYWQNDTIKTYEELNHVQKSYIDNQQIIMDSLPNNLLFNIDPSCNLSCESCRAHPVLYKEGSLENKVIQIFFNKITNNFFEKLGNQKARINITGSGDPFASPIFKNFLETFDGSKYPNLIIDLQSNGVLFTSGQWEKLKKIHHNIGKIIISIDAYKKETYLKVRRGGHFEQLQSNIQFLVEMKKSKNICELIQVNMVVQNRNYREMIDFAHHYLNLGVDCIYFSLVDNWGSWTFEEYQRQQVWSESHPNFSDFLNQLQHPIFQNPRVNTGNLTKFINHAKHQFNSEQQKLLF